MSIRLKGHGYKTKKAPRPGGGSRGNILREVSRMIFFYSSAFCLPQQLVDDSFITN